jgi:GAF domain-containing protein
VDVPRRGAHRDSVWRGVGPAQSFFRRGGQHFHLLHFFCDPAVSLAFGSGGYLPAWLAAWLPNLIFGATGFRRVRSFNFLILVIDSARVPPDEIVSDELSKLKSRHERLQLLYQVSNVIHSTLDSQEALQLIVSEAVRLMRVVRLGGADQSHVRFSGNSRVAKPAGRGAKLKLRVGEGITGWVARHGKPARVGDVTQDPRYVAARRGVKSELAVPLEVNGETRGVINVDSDRADAFSADDQELLQELAVQAAKVIHNTWLYEQLRLKVHLFESLASVSRTINSTLNLDEALRAITREACVLMRARMCSLMMLDESREWLDLRASYGAGAAYIKKAAPERRGKPARRRRAPEKTDASRQRPDFHPLSKCRTRAARRPGFAVERAAAFRRPGHRHAECLYGRPYNFSNEEIRILSALAELSAIAIEKARLYERIVDVEEQLRQNEKLSALGLLAAEVAHEIRNPLTVMKLLYHSLDLKFPAKRPAREGRANHRGENRAPEQNRGANPGFRAHDRTEIRAGEFERTG